MSGKRKAESRRWFQQALYDLRAARWNIEGGFHDTACFLAQQTGEKPLKSLLYYLGARRQALLTHSLVEMIEGSGKKVKPVLELLEEGRSLDLHYIPSAGMGLDDLSKKLPLLLHNKWFPKHYNQELEKLRQ